MNDKMRILMVEDNEIYLKALAGLLEDKGCVVARAMTREQAYKALIKNERFDVALLDIRLKEGKDATGNEIVKSGFDLIRRCRETNKRMAILMISGYRHLYEIYASEVDDYLIKGFGKEQLLTAIGNAIYRRQMPESDQTRMTKMIGHLLPYKNEIVDVVRSVTGHDPLSCSVAVEALTGVLNYDEKQIRWVVYKLAEHKENSFTVGVASTSGCPHGCIFCLSGKTPLRRKYTPEEMISQVIYGLNSCLAKGVFYPKKDRRLKPIISWTCEGDPLCHNVHNVAKTISELDKTNGLNPEFIITTVGNSDQQRIYNDRYLNLPRVKFYWSLISAFPSQRAKLMPGIKRHDLEKQRDLFQSFAEATNQKVTVTIILFPGMNDDREHLQSLHKLIGGRPFTVKVQPFAWQEGLPRELPKASEAELLAFRKSLEEMGISCRVRHILGSEIYAGCGTTIPDRFRDPRIFDNTLEEVTYLPAL